MNADITILIISIEIQIPQKLQKPGIKLSCFVEAWSKVSTLDILVLGLVKNRNFLRQAGLGQSNQNFLCQLRLVDLTLPSSLSAESRLAHRRESKYSSFFHTH